MPSVADEEPKRQERLLSKSRQVQHRNNHKFERWKESQSSEVDCRSATQGEVRSRSDQPQIGTRFDASQSEHATSPLSLPNPEAGQLEAVKSTTTPRPLFTNLPLASTVIHTVCALTISYAANIDDFHPTLNGPKVN